MSQQTNNPFSKLVVDPAKIPDPNSITLKQFQNYHSYEHQKLGSLFRSLTKSRLYIGGILGLLLLGSFYAENKARNELFGSDSNYFSIVDKGGSYLDLTTVRDQSHYAYNREFQRLFFLSETNLPDAPIHSDQLLTDLGVSQPTHGAPKIAKKTAHEKYF